jgi:DNA-binding transcriptional ArsR family regulator
VIVIRFDVPALAGTRLSISPAMEALAWLTLAASGRRHAVFGDPGAAARAVLRHPDVASVVDLLAASRDPHLSDVLTPAPRGGPWRRVLSDQLAAIESVGPDVMAAQVSAVGCDGGNRTALLRTRRLAESGRLPGRLAAGMARFWRETLHDSWSSIQGVLDSDIAERSTALATDGIGRVIGGIHPRLCWTGDSLTVDTPIKHEVTLAGGGLVLAATALSQQPMVQLADTTRSTLYYPVRRIGTGHRHRSGGLADVVGGVRATLLTDLGVDRPTLDLAGRHAMSPSTVSYHLAALHRAGLVSRRRAGRYVLYRRTRRADLLISGTE